MSVVATTTLDDEWRVLKTSYDNTTTTTNNNSNASTSTSISSEKGSVVGSLSNFAVPFFQDVTIVSSCSAAITSNSDDSLGRMPVNTTANNKVMAPSLLMESHSGGNASTFALRRRATLARMNFRSTKQTLESKYELNPEPIGEGAFGQVFVARDKTTGELVAVKKIWKEYSDNHDFVREMNALLHIQAHGGHPHICQLRENFDEPEHFALVLDLIKGGEVFEHLVQTGAYSELDASRLIREVASALAFMHGIGLVHCDLKPENLMLSNKTDSACIKMVDFGCTEYLASFQSQVNEQFANHFYEHEAMDLEGHDRIRSSGGTIAYSPPESFNSDAPVDAPLDMWALGIILHIMLTGIHPFDPNGDADDETLKARISLMEKPPLDTPDTEHLSPSAIDLLNRLLEPDPSKRLKAHEMLEHSWVRGETALSDIIADSDQKLSKFRKFRSKIETQVFQELMNWADSKNRSDPCKNGESLVEKAFKSLDKDSKGFLTVQDISKDRAGDGDEITPMTLSNFSELLGENMQNKYYPAGHVIFRQGDRGEHMFFLNSGTCEVTTKDGFHHILKHGDTFGEGGLINENGKRSATIKTLTPVHAIQIDKKSFVKYLMGSESALALKIKEKVNKRRFERAEFIIGHQRDLDVLTASSGQKIYSHGDKADSIFFVVDGTVDVRHDGHLVYHSRPGELLGVQSFYFHRSRDADAVCVSDRCCVKAMSAAQFKELATNMPEVQQAVHEMALRREFQRAIVRKLKTSFSSTNLREVFNAIDLDKNGTLNRDELRDLLTHLDESVSEDHVNLLIESLDLDSTGSINFEEFTTLFA